MKTRLGVSSIIAGVGALAFAIALVANPFSASASAQRDVAPGSGHALKVKNAAANKFARTSNMTYHKGPVMLTSSTYAVFWEPTGSTVSSTYNTLLGNYFSKVGGSGLYNNNTQYYNSTNQHIQNNSTYAGSWVDTSAYPASGCFDTATPAGCLSDAQIQAEVQKAISTNKWTAGINSLFFVFIAKGEGTCYSSGSCAFTQFCAYHSNFTYSGSTVLYANMPYTDTSPAACDVGTTPNNDIAADSTINVTSHEHMEAVTDPLGSAWYDSRGYEIGDKCAWNFGTVSLDGGLANEYWSGQYFIVQQEWDNAKSGCVQTGP